MTNQHNDPIAPVQAAIAAKTCGCGPDCNGGPGCRQLQQCAARQGG